MNFEETQKLLQEFNKLPKEVRETTFMELCRYPRNRFEEICSRILAFYFQPKNEHKLNDLFLVSLFQLIDEKNDFRIRNSKINIISEENAEGKRLDLLIYSPDNFVIGIENKIQVGLYNPLHTYKNRIKQYHRDKRYFIVLSLNKINDEDGLNKIKENGFINITYSDLFNSIKKNIGYYLSNSNQKYLIILTDFINTIEHMGTTSSLDNETKSFFYKNSKGINELIELYEKHKNDIYHFQVENTNILTEKVKKITNDDKWYIYDQATIVYHSFKNEIGNIGIESWFELLGENPVGNFKIQVTNWQNLEHWNKYENKIQNAFSYIDLIKENHRAYLTVKIIKVTSLDEVANELKETYDTLKKIVDKE